jgi:hypothetical protein
MSLHYWLLFVLIQLISLVLTIIGIPVIAVCLDHRWTIPWIWRNDDDPPGSPLAAGHNAFVWLALRNPVANLRHVKEVSAVGRPLFYRTWTDFGKQWYVKLGWMSNGYPACSAGAGRGY